MFATWQICHIYASPRIVACIQLIMNHFVYLGKNRVLIGMHITMLYSLCVGLLCDLLWSDPDKETKGWGENDRGVSFTFGMDIVTKFLNRHDLDLICRAHQVNTYLVLCYTVMFLMIGGGRWI